MPRTSRDTFSVISARASAISSRTRSCTRSVTSWIASPISDVGRWSVIARDGPEESREQEGAGEGGPDQALGPVGAWHPPGRRRPGRLGRRGRGGLRARPRGGADARGGARGAGALAGHGRGVGRVARRLLRQALGLVGLLARPPRLLGGLLGL